MYARVYKQFVLRGCVLTCVYVHVCMHACTLALPVCACGRVYRHTCELGTCVCTYACESAYEYTWLSKRCFTTMSIPCCVTVCPREIHQPPPALVGMYILDQAGFPPKNPEFSKFSLEIRFTLPNTSGEEMRVIPWRGVYTLKTPKVNNINSE